MTVFRLPLDRRGLLELLADGDANVAVAQEHYRPGAALPFGVRFPGVFAGRPVVVKKDTNPDSRGHYAHLLGWVKPVYAGRPV